MSFYQLLEKCLGDQKEVSSKHSPENESGILRARCDAAFERLETAASQGRSIKKDVIKSIHLSSESCVKFLECLECPAQQRALASNHDGIDL